MVTLYCQRCDVKRKQQQPWCGMAVDPPMSSRDFSNSLISLSAKWAANMALQGSPWHAVASPHFSFTPFPLVKAAVICPALSSSQLEQQNFYQCLLYPEEVMFILCKSSQTVLLTFLGSSGLKGERVETEIFYF